MQALFNKTQTHKQTQTSFSLDLPSEDHNPLPQLPSKIFKNQALINLIPSLPAFKDPTEAQEDSQTDVLDLSLGDSDSDSYPDLQEPINPQFSKGTIKKSPSSINNQIERTAMIRLEAFVAVDKIEEEKSSRPVNTRIPKQSEGFEDPAGSFKGIFSQNGQWKEDPLRGYCKTARNEETPGVNDIENPESGSENDNGDKKGKKILEKMYFSNGKMMTRKEIEAEMAKQRLQNFDLGQLKMTKNNKFDQRYNVTKEFQSLCESAKLDSMSFYKENIMRFSQSYGSLKSTQVFLAGSMTSQRSMERGKIIGRSQNKDMKQSELKVRNIKLSEQEISALINKAKRQVREFDMSKLVYKKDKSLDKRFNVNKEYLGLLEKCEPSYYLNSKESF